MSKYKLAGISPRLGSIGEQAASDLGGDPNGIFIYVEMGDRWYSVNLFRDEGEAVRYYDPSSELDHSVRDAWKAEEPDKRWCVMEYEIKGNAVDAQFRFPDQVDVENVQEDRRQVALVKRYGDKPIIYPPMLGEFREKE